MIQLNHVSKKFPDLHLFKDISIFLPKASYTFIYGAANSGKTTLLRMIMAYEKPDSGSMTVDGLDITAIPQARVPFLRRQIGLIETSPLMLENRTVSENIAVPMQVAGFDHKASQERVAETLNESGLELIADVPIQRLDQDQRRLVACARATVHRPKILLVDEPAVTLRENTEITQQNLIKKMHAQGTTVVTTGTARDAAESVVASLPGGGKAFVIEDGKFYQHEHIKHTP